MAEIIQRDGTWAFDGSTVRITPGLHRTVPLFRQTYGEIAVPLEAVSGVVFEPERKRGRPRARRVRRPPAAGRRGAAPRRPSRRTVARLRELGELHRSGVLTDEEFAMTKAAVLRGF
ncbi:DUF4429 domain-containing protein [Streptomyces sp. TRM68367]|nr:DUF4429 domain-containing protein [Streptomyces sp. TRM68367]MBC9725749.1 DUF4429 domain-containing protein [Streptomyces sp. TRM68367]